MRIFVIHDIHDMTIDMPTIDMPTIDMPTINVLQLTHNN